MRRFLLAATVVVLGACGDLQHENPYDPQAPAAGQARTSLAGTVSLESVGGVTPTLAGITVSVAGQSYTAVTDAAGHYVIAGVPAGAYTIQAVLGDYETATVTGVTATLDTGGRTVTVPDLALRRVRAQLRGAVSLRLPDSTVETSGGASVSLSAGGASVAMATAGAATAAAVVGSAVTSPSGDFVISDVPAPVGAYTLTATRLGYVTQTTTVTFQDGAFVVQTVQLQIDPGAIVGTVAVRGAADSFGVTVRARGATLGGTPWEATTTSAADGSFRLSGLPAGTYGVTLERADLVTTAAGTRAVLPGADTALGTLEALPATGALRGIVQLPSAASSAGVVVTATGTAGTASAVTDAAGAYTLSGLPVGAYAVTATRAPEWQPATVSEAGVVVRDQTTTLATASLSPWATAALSGVARLEGATDHSGTTVTLTGADFRGLAVGPTTTPTAASGAWSFTGLRAGSYQVAFSHPGFDTPAPAGVSIITGQTASAGTLTLAASRGALSGTVTAAGATGYAGTVVEISGGPDGATAVTNDLGAWQVTGLRVGTTYAATFRRTGYVTQSSTSLHVDAGATTAVGAVSLAVATTSAISGVATVVRPTDAASSAGIAVGLTGTDLNGAPVSASATTISGGAYTIPLLPQGTYTLTFTKDHYDTRQTSGIAVVAGAAATAPAVTLPVATGSIAGQVVLSAGTAAGFVQGTDFSGVVVTLGGLEAGVTVAAAVTDASGGYRFDGVPVHTSGLSYGVSAQRAGYGTGAGAVVAAPGTTVTVTPSPLTLTVNAGTVTGNVAVNDTGTRAAPANGAATVTLTGTAFNATAFGASAGNVGSGFTLANVPAGSYDLVATSGGRTCTTTLTMPVTVSAGQTLGLAQAPPSYTFVCTDAVAPTGVSLGVPQGAGAQPGFTAATSVDVPVIAHATDGNFAGYQYVTGAVPDWNGAPTTAGPVSPIPFPPGTLSSDGTWTLWVRAVDQVGNAGPASSVQVVRDATRPANVVLTTARPFVNDTTTTALVAGGADPNLNFRSYQSCVYLLANATGACPIPSPSPPCAMADSGATITVSFASANTKACVYALSSDQAGNTSANIKWIEIVSDLMPPTAPVIAPLYDPSILSVHAESVDFFVVSGATDPPAGGATPWKDVAWLEVDVGGGFLPLCPFAACRDASNVYNPCTCSCTDARLVCDGATFKAIRVPLLDGAANVIGVRAVDLAGNVGSGATQQVPTATSLYTVAVNPDRENLPRGQGRLVAYRSTDSNLRLRDLGPDGKPDTADDAACDVGATGAWGCVVHRIAVLGPQLVLHADGDATLNARRPGTGGRFCAVDDTSYAFYAIPGTTQVRNVTGSLNSAHTREYAAWLERAPGTGADTVKVQAPSVCGHLAHESCTYCASWLGRICLSWVTGFTDPPAPVTLLSPGTYAVSDLLEGGDCLLVELAASPRYQVACKAGGLGNATGVTFWTLPASATAATLRADGAQLAWAEYDTTTRATRLHVRSAGPDHLYGTADDGDATRLGPGGYAAPVSMAMDGGHVVVSESLYQGSYWLLHWNAGPDAVFDGAATADDTVSRVLPSSVRRDSLSLLVGPQVAYSVESDGGNLSDVLTLDLSTFRWETVESADFSDLVTNGAGTLFFHRGGALTARLPSGAEQAAGFSASYLAATGAHLLTSDGGSVSVRDFTAAGGFGAPTLLHSGTNYGVTAGGRWGLMLTSEGGTRYRFSDLWAPTPVATVLPVIAGTSPNTNGFGISDALIAYQCGHSGWNACIHQVGTDGVFGTADDVTLVLNHAGALPEYGAYGLAVGGDKVAFNDGTSMMVVGPGPDGLFNTADDVAWNLGPIGTSTMGNIAVAGNYAAWLKTTANGEQVMYADLALGITRQLTTHYSNKVNLALDPSGRLTWIDYAFTTPALFVYAP